MKNWVKLGQVYSGGSVHPKLFSHAANPLAVPLENDVFRVFYSGRDSQNRSSVGYVDIDICQQRVVYINSMPVFTHGQPGTFFRDGVSIGNIYRESGFDYILFMGWQNDPGRHWRGDIGRLRLQDSLDLVLDPVDRPFLGIDSDDPISLSYPWIIHDGAGYRMWYGSTGKWDAGNGEMLHVIKYATSNDGRIWRKHGQVIDHELGVAQAFSRPSVYIDDVGYHMWFSYRGGLGSRYRIGYAFSPDGLRWQNRLNESGIDVSLAGWDSDMIEYPYVFSHKDRRYMLYNGNDYGRTGFGLAVLEHG